MPEDKWQHDDARRPELPPRQTSAALSEKEDRTCAFEAAPIRLLLVESDGPDAQRIQQQLAEAEPHACTLEHATRLSEALERVAAGRVDVMLLGLDLPDARDLEAITWTQAMAPQLPVVALTDRDDEELALQAIQLGAQDYLVKGNTSIRSLLRAARAALERKRAEDELFEAAADLARDNRRLKERDRVREEFLAHVSHELRTPLASMHQFLTILADGLGGEVGAPQREYLRAVLRGTHQLRGMIEELLEVSRAELGRLPVELQVTSVAEIVRELAGTWRSRAAARGVEVSLQVAEDLPRVHADPRWVERVLEQLAGRAIEVSPENGRVRIEAGVRAESPEFLRVTVTDDGEPIDPELRDRVFDPPRDDGRSLADDRRGLGIGLYFARHLVQSQGGRIWVEGAPGCSFSFTLPVYSLGRLLVPLVTRDGRPADSVTVLRIDVQPGARAVTASVEARALVEIRGVLAARQIPDLLLLPERAGSGQRGAVYAVLPGRRDPAAHAAQRIRRECASNALLRTAGLQLRIGSALVDLPASHVRPHRDRVEVLASSVEALVHQPTAEQASHFQEE